MFKIAITGPESSGKSALSEKLSSVFNCVWVPEYAREYLEKKNGEYSKEDLLLILKGQLEAEKKAENAGDRFLFCDTDPLVIKIWSQVKFGSVHRTIEDAWQKHNYDLTFLMYPDIDWVDDPLRESKEMRFDLFEMYKYELEESKKPFYIVKGKGDIRVQNSMAALNTFFPIP